MYDPSGNDAIWLQSSKMVQALGQDLGHSSLLVQNSKGEWYYFFYAINGVTFQKVTNSNALTSLNNLNEYLGEDGNRAYDSSTYIAGDFTATFNYCQGLLDKYNKNMLADGTNPDYSVTKNNCSQVSWKALMKGKLNDGTSVQTFVGDQALIYYKEYPYLGVPDAIPNRNGAQIEFLFRNTAYTYSQYVKQLNKRLKYDYSKYKNVFWYIFYGKQIKADANAVTKLLKKKS